MRDELNRNSYGDLVHKQYEKMDPLDPMTDIPEDDRKDVGTTTSQSLSSEDADHSGFSQNEAGPADATPPLGKDANETYPHGYPVYDAAFAEDHESTDETPLENVPDADEIQMDSPVDPAAQDTDQHGIDLLNGVGGVDDENDRKLPEDF
ncbi:hypothetical protein [Paenibacillus faecalis]|uniref:hypothetical protein n=1 Tax=Paenibacillus faecalis TaxID=2079532 RepID=UPI000D1102AB|nr:hypothetical protein [Paenibacillus faecalis]